MRAGRRFGTFLAVLGAAGLLLTLTAPARAEAVRAPGPRTVGGSVAEPGQFPWMVHLSMGCGGTVVAPRVVLTAAHCLDGTGPSDDVVATIGRVRLSETGGEEIRSTYTVRNPDYTRTGAGDWGLVELARPTTAPAVPIAAPGDTSQQRGTLEIAGWGATREGGPPSDALRYARLPFVNDGTCAKVYEGFAPASEMCAGGGPVDACQGDSGGPLFKHLGDRRWVQLGIVSYGYGCARPGFPGVYAEVQAFSDRIRARIGTDGGLVR